MPVRLVRACAKAIVTQTDQYSRQARDDDRADERGVKAGKRRARQLVMTQGALLE